MIGALIGDISGSRYEWANNKSKEFPLLDYRCRPTDDSVMTLAIAQAILLADGDMSRLAECAVREMQAFGLRYPRAGYGGTFCRWLVTENPRPYNSWGNGAAMRISACGWAFDTLEETQRAARLLTGVTHDHPEGLKGGESVAAAIFLFRTGSTMEQVRRYVLANYYAIDFTLDEIRDEYEFDVSCQGSVPQAFEALFESTGFEDAIRNAISIGGDSDTIAAIAGGMAEACYGVDEGLRGRVLLNFLDEDQRKVVRAFEALYPPRKAPEKSTSLVP